MSADGPRAIADLAASEIDNRGFTGFIREWGIGGVLGATFLTLIDAISSAGGVLLAPWSALADALSLLVARVVGGPTELIAQSVSESDGWFAELGIGPLGFPIAVLSVMIGIYLFFVIVQRIPFSPLAFVRDRGG
jgi:hypothetical protein